MQINITNKTCNEINYKYDQFEDDWCQEYREERAFEESLTEAKHLQNFLIERRSLGWGLILLLLMEKL